ncbi:MAG: hypothetical protein ACYC6Y_12205, partial [Thermoguttaceae bacterium]
MNHFRRLQDQVDDVARRYRQLYGWLACGIVWLAVAALGASVLWAGWTTGWLVFWASPLLCAVAAAATLAAAWLATRATRDPQWVARRIEARHRELDSLLVTAVEQRPPSPGDRFGYLQDRLFLQSLAYNRRSPWQEDVPDSRVRLVQLTGLACLTLLVTVMVGLGTQAAQARRFVGLAPGREPRTAPPPVFRVAVSPGNADLERGTSLVVTARFKGRVPDDATLLVRDRSGKETRVPMTLSLSDPVFGARVPDVQTEFDYRVEYGGQKTGQFHVAVFEYPELVRADAELEFPSYTFLPQKRVEDTRTITAVEGTDLTLFCDLNKPVAAARLVDDEGKSVDLSPVGDDPTVYSVRQRLATSARYRLQLTDGDGRANREPPQFVFNVTPNRPPDVKITLPARDVRVSPIEELETRANLWDDYGVRAYGLTYTLPGQPPRELPLGREIAGNDRRDVEHLIALEDLRARPDQLLAYYYWAEDFGPDGRPRRSMGDMYFAEVRHFDEIFRQGEQPPAGESQPQQQQQQQGQEARQAEQLAELQKQIINATWTLIRRETAPRPSDKFAGDLEEVKSAQAGALDKLKELAEKLEDPQSLGDAEAVKGFMLDAMAGLIEAADKSSPSALPMVLSSEQAAYQAILKLRAREHQVARSRQSSQQQQSGSAGGPQSRSQQQLEQLELTDSENRYETERQAAPQQDQEQREDLQVLNRLRELARRQNDLNRRLQELQSALEEAQNDKEREDIRQQLKRLREQQQEMLRDTDELAERMQRPENQERMSQSRGQVDQTREDIRQTTEALRQGQVSQALASGTRAQRQLEELEDEFRDAASGRFSQQVEQLREDARRLDQQEQSLARQLDDVDRARRDARSLREPVDQADLQGEFRRQHDDLQRLLENMRRTVEQAEQAEPLMAGQLYDAARQASQQRLDDTLDAARQLLDQGLVDEARTAEQQAGRGITSLREGVEHAAESVLGNQDEALHKAQQTLQQLAQELDDEIRRATGESSADAQENTPRAPQPDGQSQQAGRQQQTSDDQPGRRGPEQAGPTQPDRPQTGDPQQQASQDPDGQPSPDGRREGQLSETIESGRSQVAGQPPRQAGLRDAPEARPSGPNGRREGPPEPPSRPDNGGGPQSAAGPAELEQFRGPGGPITGEFTPWSDRLRDVEEMVDDPQLRSDVARVRESARDIRRQMRRDFTGPNWDLVRQQVVRPLNEIRDRLAEELLRKRGDRETVPIDRDPVPARYADQVRRY